MSTAGTIVKVARGIKSAKPANVDYRIPVGAALLVLLVGAAADMLQALLNLLWFTGILGVLAWAACTFLYGLALIVLYMAFWGLGYNPLGGKHVGQKIISFFTSLTIEATPIFSFIPSVTIWAWRNISISREEDRERASQSATMQGKAAIAMRQRVARAAHTGAQRNATVRGAVSRNIAGKASSVAAPAGRERDMPHMRTLRPETGRPAVEVRRTPVQDRNAAQSGVRRTYAAAQAGDRRAIQAA